MKIDKVIDSVKNHLQFGDRYKGIITTSCAKTMNIKLVVSFFRPLLKNMLVITYPFLILFNYIKSNLSKDNNVRVILFHWVEQEDIKKFSKIIHLLERKFGFITPEEFEMWRNNIISFKSRKLLLTFDDGFASDHRVVKDILTPLKIRGIFFIVSSSITYPEQSNDIIVEGIFRGNNPGSDFLTRNKLMSKLEVNNIQLSGNVIGSHTSNHYCLSAISNEKSLHDEIVSSGEILSEIFMTQVNYFAYPFGKISDINEKCLKLILKNYTTLFSGIRGSNKPSYNVFFRDEISLSYNPLKIFFILYGGFDLFYVLHRKIISRWNS